MMFLSATRRTVLAAIVVLGAALAACQRAPDAATADAVPYVRTAEVQAAITPVQGLSGTIQARVETPLAFQVSGRLVARHVDAGQRVATGQVLFEIDPIDFEQAVRMAEAEVAAAESAWHTAQADLARVQALRSSAFVSQQALDRAELALREVQSRRDAAAARLAQARNARACAQLRSPAAGVVIDVAGQPGQVIAAGQPVAVLAQDGQREVEVHFPDGMLPPARGEAILPDGQRRQLRLREAAPMVDASGRTRRARYAVSDLPATVALGSVVATRFAPPQATDQQPLWQVPIGALDERGHGPRVWRLRNGHPEPLPVQIRAVDDRQATVAGALRAGDRVIALGTHLLQEGMAVQELPR